MAIAPNAFGWLQNETDGTWGLYFNGTRILQVTSTGVVDVGTFSATTVAATTIDPTGQVTLGAGLRFDGTAGFFGLGPAQAVTIATGVATVTAPYVILDAEGAGTTDQLDTITYTGAADGDLLLLTVTATDTITVDDANINLAAATRAIAPGGSLLLRFDGTEWTEVLFTAATDNV